MTTLPTIYLTKKKKSVKDIRAGLPAPIRFITSPKLTAGLAGTLSLLTGTAALGAAKVALTTGFIGGALESEKVRKFATGKILAPEKGGRFFGDIVQDPTILFPKDKSILQSAKDITTKGGLAAGAAALGVGGVIAGVKTAKKVKSVFKSKASIPQTPGVPVFDILPSMPTQPLSPQIEPVGVMEAPKEVKEKPLAVPTINNKIIVRPEINVRVSQSRKFINQQNQFIR